MGFPDIGLRSVAAACGDGMVQGLFGQRPFALRAGDARQPEQCARAVRVCLPPALGVGATAGQCGGVEPLDRQRAVLRGQCVVPLRFDRGFEAPRGGFVPAQRGGAVRIRAGHGGHGAQHGGQRIPMPGEGVAVVGFAQHARCPQAFAFGALRHRQGLLLAQRAEHAVGLRAAAVRSQRVRAQGERARRQRLVGDGIERGGGLGGAAIGQGRVGEHQRTQRRVSGRQGIEMRGRGVGIAAGQRRLCGSHPRRRFEARVLRRLRQQFFGLRVSALMQGLEAVAQARARIALTPLPPQPERQPDQFPQQPECEQRGAEHQQAADQRGFDGGAEITHQHEAGILHQRLREQRTGQREQQPEQQIAEEVHARLTALLRVVRAGVSKCRFGCCVTSCRITSPAAPATVRACCPAWECPAPAARRAARAIRPARSCAAPMPATVAAPRRRRG